MTDAMRTYISAQQALSVACGLPSPPVNTKTSTPAPALEELRPMLLNETQRAFSDPAWAFEIKFDGYRVLGDWSDAGGAAAEPPRRRHERGDGGARLDRQQAALHRRRRDLRAQRSASRGDAEFRRLFKRQAPRFKAGDDRWPSASSTRWWSTPRSVMHLPLLRAQAPLDQGARQRAAHVWWSARSWRKARGLFQAALEIKLEGIVAKRCATGSLPLSRR